MRKSSTFAYSPSELKALERVETKPDWNRLAQIITQGSFLQKEQREGTRLPVIAVLNPDRLVVEYLYRTLRVGQQPREVTWYRRANKEKVLVWQWRVAAQLEVYWVLSNLQRFCRGPVRQHIEQAVHQLDNHLQTANRLRRYDMQATLQEDVKLTDKQKSPGFLERTTL